MILTCPKCATSYTIDEAHLGPNGRNVRCQSCRATWFATKPEEPMELVAEAAPKPPREVKARELPKLYRQLMEDKKRLKAITQQAAIWGGMTVAFVAILLVAYVLRVDIVRAFPQAAKAFASVDPNVEISAVGVDFPKGKGHQTMTPQLKGGRFVVSVTTDVVNLTDQIKPVPPIQVRFLDAHGNEVGNTLIVLKNMMIDPKGTRSISFDLPDPKNLISDVVLRFDLMAMKELKEKGRYDKYYKAAAKRAENSDGHGEAAGDHDAADAHHDAEPDAHGAAAPELKSEISTHDAPESSHGAAESHNTPSSHEAPALKPEASGHH